jgi:hypothetical protein
MEATPQTAPKRPNTTGRRAKGTAIEMMTKAPEKMPATPMPAMALPTMRAVLDGATAQTNEPTSKMKMATRKVYLT